MKKEYAQEVTDTIIDLLKKGVAPWQKPWEPNASPGSSAAMNPVSGTTYKGMNQVWLRSLQQLNGYDDNRWMTYKQATSVDAQVRRGEKAATIEFWKWDAVKPVLDESGKPKRDSDGQEIMERVRLDRPIRKTAYVFNAKQIDGLAPLPPREVKPEPERIALAEKIIENSGATILHRPGDRAFYSGQLDTIVLPSRDQFKTPDAYYGTALHELGHWTGHESRLNRDMKHPFGSQGYAREELRAEIGSMMMSDQIDIPYDPAQNAAYVGSWISLLEEKSTELFKAASDADKLSKYVLGFESKKAVEANADDTIRRPGYSVRLPDNQADAGTTEGIVDMTVKVPSDAQRQGQADRQYITVPYAEKDEAKELGAKWDSKAKSWYVPADINAAALSKWTGPTVETTGAANQNPVDGFKEALTDAGLQIEGDPVMDGRIHRVKAEGDQGAARSGAYAGYLDGRPAGFIQNFRTGLKTTWKAEAPAAGIDQGALAAEAAARKAERETELRQQYEAAAVDAKRQVETATPATEHPYLTEKGIDPHGVMVDDQARLVVPITNLDDKLQSIQTIAADGTKGFMKGGRVSGGMFKIGNMSDETQPVIIAEGFATGASLAEATGYPVAVAFISGNLGPVAEAVRDRFPEREIIIAGDNDWRREIEGKPNVGAIKAIEAAEKVKAVAVLAPRSDRLIETDWNDYAQRHGVAGTADRFQVERRLAHEEHPTRPQAAAHQQQTWEQRSAAWQKGAEADEAEKTESFEAAEAEGLGID